jgi:putative addiction module component (TIGR02574 family)
MDGVLRRKITGMTKRAQAVLADALRLDDAARAELAAELLASLDGPDDPNAEAEWEAEIQRRVAAIESGTVTLESWEEVKRRIETQILGR